MIQNLLNTGVFSKLSGGTALTALLGGTLIYFEQAPDGQALPFVVWSYQFGGDQNRTNNREITMGVYVRGYAATPSLAGSIDAAVDALMHRGSISVSGWTNYDTQRESSVSMIENQRSTEQVFMSGGVYRVRLDKD